MESVTAGGMLPPLVILNPASKRGKGLKRWLERKLKGGRGELVVTRGRGDGERLGREAAIAGRGVVACGGDGTLAEVANGVLSTGQAVPFGLLPIGNGNDYAYYTLDLPRTDEAALEAALTGPIVPMDVGSLNGRFFVNSFGVGLDANINVAAERMKRNPLMRGQLLYWSAVLNQLIFHYGGCPTLRITLDGETEPEQAYVLAAVNTGPTAGAGFRVNHGADPRDGLLDVCIVAKPKQMRAMQLLPVVRRGEHFKEPEVKHLRVHECTIEADQEVYAHTDGETIRAKRFEVASVPQALHMRLAPSVAARFADQG
jgi:diacylglycerol kinase (ATP)